jgi:DNA-binding MarR family transcriptional regulator
VLVRLARALRQSDSTGLTPSQISALTALEEFGPMRISTLAERETMAAPVATRVIASLEQSGSVQRHDDPLDGRACVVALTDTGRESLERAGRERTVALSERLERLSRSERAKLEAALPVLERLAREA